MPSNLSGSHRTLIRPGPKEYTLPAGAPMRAERSEAHIVLGSTDHGPSNYFLPLLLLHQKRTRRAPDQARARARARARPHLPVVRHTPSSPPNPVPLSPPARHHRPAAMLPYSGDHQRSPPPPPPPRAVFSSSLSPSAAPFPAADPVGPGPGPVRDLPTAPSVYAAGGDWGAVSWMEPPASYMAPAATPPGYKGNKN
jgi:hypothetical protein